MPSLFKGSHLATSKPAKFAGGFSLIEIALSMFVILAIIAILFTVAGTYNITRRSNLQGIAAEVADRQIETLKHTNYDSLTIGNSSFSDSSLSKLPNSSTSQTIALYQSSNDIKQISIQITWNEGGIGKSFGMDTLVYKYRK